MHDFFFALSLRSVSRHLPNGCWIVLEALTYLRADKQAIRHVISQLHSTACILIEWTVTFEVCSAFQDGEHVQ